MIQYIKRLVGEDAKKLICPIALSILDSLFNSCMYGVMLFTLIDLSNGEFSGRDLLTYTLVLVGIFVIRCVLQAISFTQAQCLGPRVSRKLRLEVGNHIRKLNLGFFTKNSIGKLNSVLLSDISDYEVIITHCLCDFIKVVSFTVMSLVFAFVINWKYGLVMLLLIVLALPLLLKSGKVSGKKAGQLRNTNQNVISRLVEYVNGIKTFRLYNLTGSKFARLDHELQTLRKDSISSEIAVMPLALSFYVITSLIVPVTLIMGGYLYAAGEIEIVKFLIILLLSVSLANIMGALSSIYPQIKSITKASENICNVLDEKPFSYEEEKNQLTSFDIAFSKVDFAYENNVPILKNVSFEAKQGTTTALIGPSGSGKTTIVSLLARFWDTTGGTISVGGVDIKKISPDVLTKYMAIVFQEVYLLNDTIMNNIRIGRPEATDEEVFEAAKAARCHEFITKMEKGYETVIGEGGSTLSGGEKQRISIARALLKDAPIVLLDETTSNLDADNEKDIQRAFDRLMKEKTVLVIAHRLNTIRNADNILVLEKGVIKEEGTHEQLLAEQGWYYGICQEQEKARKWKIKSDQGGCFA